MYVSISQRQRNGGERYTGWCSTLCKTSVRRRSVHSQRANEAKKEKNKINESDGIQNRDPSHLNKMTYPLSRWGMFVVGEAAQ